MRYKVIACRVFAREISLLAARSSAVLDITWIRQGLHNYPTTLHEEIQQAIDRSETLCSGAMSATRPPEDYQGIILGFGLCSGATVGLRSRRLPLILPRAHDCIALLLGSQSHFERELSEIPGTYWLSPGWIEEASFPSGSQRDVLESRLRVLYGGDNARYLIELERDSLASYVRCVLIQWPQLAQSAYEDRLRAIAQDLGWRPVVMEGQSAWLARVLNGEWAEPDAAVSGVRTTLEQSYDEDIVRTVTVAEQPGEGGRGDA